MAKNTRPGTDDDVDASPDVAYVTILLKCSEDKGNAARHYIMTKSCNNSRGSVSPSIITSSCTADVDTNHPFMEACITKLI